MSFGAGIDFFLWPVRTGSVLVVGLAGLLKLLGLAGLAGLLADSLGGLLNVALKLTGILSAFLMLLFLSAR